MHRERPKPAQRGQRRRPLRRTKRPFRSLGVDRRFVRVVTKAPPMKPPSAAPGSRPMRMGACMMTKGLFSARLSRLAQSPYSEFWGLQIDKMRCPHVYRTCSHVHSVSPSLYTRLLVNFNLKKERIGAIGRVPLTCQTKAAWGALWPRLVLYSLSCFSQNAEP